VGTPTCHSISDSIPFHLTALLPLSIHQSALRPSQQHLNHHRKPLSHSLLLCLLPNKGNAPWEAELHPTRHSYQPCQPASGRADWTAGNLYIRRPSNQREAVHRKAVHSVGVTCQWQTRRKLCKTAWRQCDQCPTACHAASWTRPSPATASSRQPATALATLCRGPPWSSVQAQPHNRRTPTPVANRTLLHDITLQRHLPSGPVTH